MNAISTLLIDRSRLFREGLRKIISGSPFSVDYEASSSGEALNAFGTTQPATQPELVLLGMPDGGDGSADRIPDIRAALPNAHIVVLADQVRVDRLSDALSEGVDGYLLKDMSAEALLQSLQLVLLGEKVFPTTLAHLLANRRMAARDDEQPQAGIGGLSQRETQILMCLLNGASNKQIANELNIAEGTVKVHLKAVLKKIGVRNRTQAAIWALNNDVGVDVFSGRRQVHNGAAAEQVSAARLISPTGIPVAAAKGNDPVAWKTVAR